MPPKKAKAAGAVTRAPTAAPKKAAPAAKAKVTQATTAAAKKTATAAPKKPAVPKKSAAATKKSKAEKEDDDDKDEDEDEDSEPEKKITPAATKAPAKTTAAARKKAPAKKTAAAPVAKTAAASKKRKAADEDEDDDEDADEDEEDAAAMPSPKKAKVEAASAASAKKTAAKKTAAPKKVAATKKATAKKTASAPKKNKSSKAEESDKENADKQPTQANTKRKRDLLDDQADGGDDGDDKQSDPPSKKSKSPPVPKKARAPRKAAAPKKVVPAKGRIGKKVNSAPTQLLDVFVFGEGSAGELGLGSKIIDGKKPIDIKRPRLNAVLSDLGIVQLAAGGMHGVALTKDNKILTWGVNDEGTLGRETQWAGGLVDADADPNVDPNVEAEPKPAADPNADSDADDSDDGDDTGLNPKESMPTEVDMTDVEEGSRFVQVVGSDNCTFALTEDGKVYGCGTFRSGDGNLGFSESVHRQRTLVPIPDLKDIRQLAAGTNHVLALDGKGKVFAWGSGQQNQLGRKVFEREIKHSLRPGGIGLLPLRGAKAVKVSCGSYHSFVLDQEGRVYAFGLNNFGELAIKEGAGEEDAAELRPTLINNLKPYKIADIAGGEHHSIACTTDGRLLVWGRIDGYRIGLSDDLENFFTEDNTLFDNDKPRILFRPAVIEGVEKIAKVAAGTDNSFAITADGKVYSWGFAANYQTGLGSDEDVKVPTLLENTAVKGRNIVYAGAGGQFSMIAAVAESQPAA